jgi:putative ABC transport system substrate-binding protein
MIQRREFIALVGGAAATWPIAARGQQQAMPVIGFLSGTTPEGYAQEAAFVRKGLNDAGFVEGQNVEIEYRWANDAYEQLPALAASLVRQGVAVIITIGTSLSAKAAAAATTSIPVVFVVGADPVGTKLIASLNRPGGNLTGMTLYSSALGPKRIDILRDLVPKASLIAILVNPANPNSDSDAHDVRGAAQALGIQFLAVAATNEREIDAAFETIVRRRVSGLLLSSDALFGSRSNQLVPLAARHAVPTLYNNRQGPDLGGLVSYAADRAEMYRQAGVYAARILKGAKPPDLPVQLPTKFELVINLKTASALGLAVPLSLQVAADEVIE